jgi:hypothetical protein
MFGSRAKCDASLLSLALSLQAAAKGEKGVA